MFKKNHLKRGYSFSFSLPSLFMPYIMYYSLPCTSPKAVIYDYYYYFYYLFYLFIIVIYYLYLLCIIIILLFYYFHYFMPYIIYYSLPTTSPKEVIPFIFISSGYSSDSKLRKKGPVSKINRPVDAFGRHP